MDTLFGEGQSGLKVVLFVIVVLGLLALAFWLLRQFGGGRLVNSATRGRQPRLGVIDQATVDSRRRLVLIRRDNVEHLLFIGGPSDVVVEQNIVRAATAEREPGPARPPAMPRVPVAEDSMWPLQPRTPRKVRTADPLAELADQLSRVRGVGEPAEQRRPPRLQPAPPARSTADAALKPTTAEMAQPLAPRKVRTADPLAELADQLSRVRGVGEPAEQRRPPRLQPAPPARSAADDNQNLSEIAQRLEPTLRRPAKGSDDARTAGNPKTTGDARLDTILRRPFRADEPRAPSEAPKASSEPAAPPREPDAQGRGDDKAPSEAAAPPREPDAQGRGDDKAPSEAAAPPPEPDTQGRGDDKAPSEPAAPPPEPDVQGRGDDGSVTNDRPWRLGDLSFVPSGNGRETATINGVEVVKENGRYWIITANGPLWSNIDERGVDPALNYLFEKRRQERQSGQ
jgi:flagellar protein FliO/FliZ